MPRSTIAGDAAQDTARTGPPATDPGERLTHNAALGRWGEEAAARHLRAGGMVVLARNWRCSSGEADLVLRDGDHLVVAEVKTRSTLNAGTPHEAITQAKAERLQRIAQEWIAEHVCAPAGVRIDLVAVLRPRRGATRVEHVRGVC